MNNEKMRECKESVHEALGAARQIQSSIDKLSHTYRLQGVIIGAASTVIALIVGQAIY